MQKFIQYTPTEILFGENTQAEVGKEVKKWGGSRVFIVYGGGSVKKSGLLAQVEEALEKEGLAYEEFGGVKPNPRMAYAQEGVEKAIEFGADFLLAVGGGSSIDTAKAIAHGVANPDWSLEEIWGGEITLTRSTPVEDTACRLRKGQYRHKPRGRPSAFGLCSREKRNVAPARKT